MLELTINLMLKAPVAGRVKTRLAAEIGHSAAVKAYRELVDCLLDGLGGSRPIRVFFDPPEARALMVRWLGEGMRYAPQPGGTLGQRLAVASETAYGEGARAVVFLGGDCPYVDDGVLRDVESRLETHDVVFGPAVDGGYYLVATRRHEPEIFRGIPWGTDTVLEKSLRRARELGLRTSLLEEREDVDDREGWIRARRFIRSRAGSAVDV